MLFQVHIVSDVSLFFLQLNTETYIIYVKKKGTKLNWKLILLTFGTRISFVQLQNPIEQKWT